jgi:hypothetical protein
MRNKKGRVKTWIKVLLFFLISTIILIIAGIILVSTPGFEKFIEDTRINILIMNAKNVVLVAEESYDNRDITDGENSCIKAEDFYVDYGMDMWGNYVNVCSVFIENGKVVSVSYGSNKIGSQYINSVSIEDINSGDMNIFTKGTEK